MSDYTTRDAVEFAMDGNVSSFQSAVNDLWMAKVQQQIDLKKIEVASTFMSADSKEEIVGETDDDQEV